MDTDSPVLDARLQRYAKLDQRLLAAVRGIRILSTVAWPASLEDRMIADYRQGRLALPQVSYVRPDLADARAELAAIEAEAGSGDPLGDYLCRTAA
ncbi:MAG: flavohemoglobin expression-modulating QEGLA motif protein, partial [Rhodanobacter sp.]